MTNSQSATFGNLSAGYNNLLGFASTKVVNYTGGGYEHRFGPSAVIMNGHTHHFLSSASSTDPARGLSYFIFDKQCNDQTVAFQRRVRPGEDNVHDPTVQTRIEGTTLNNLKEMLLETNPFAQSLQQIGLSLQNQQDPPLAHAALRNGLQLFEVCSVRHSTSTGERTLQIRNTDGHRLEDVKMTSDRVEPLVYPLLFPHGTRGWSYDDKHSFSFLQYLASRMLKPDIKSTDGDLVHGGPDFLTVKHATMTQPFASRHGEEFPLSASPAEIAEYGSEEQVPLVLRVNAMKLLPKLAQTYLVDQLSRHIDLDLMWKKKNQGAILSHQVRHRVAVADRERELANAEGIVNIPAQYVDTFLPGSQFQSPRHLRQLAKNVLTLVSEKGPPHVFMTCKYLFSTIAKHYVAVFTL